MILVLMPGIPTFLKLVLVCFFTVVLVDSIFISWLQYVSQYPDGTSIPPLKTKTQFLRRPFQLSVNEVFGMKAEYFSFKMKVLTS